MKERLDGGHHGVALHPTYATITLFALFLIWAAFDDITTDNSTTFRAEYAGLIACAAWLAFVAIRLFRAGQHVSGVISVVALAAAVWAQRDIRPGIVPGLWTAYVIMTTAYLWFVVLALGLGWQAVRVRAHSAAPLA